VFRGSFDLPSGINRMRCNLLHDGALIAVDGSRLYEPFKLELGMALPPIKRKLLIRIVVGEIERQKSCMSIIWLRLFEPQELAHWCPVAMPTILVNPQQR